MATTKPGGYYLGTDGKPHDANGKPIVEEAPAVTVVTPPASPVEDAIPADQPSAPEPAPVEGEKPSKDKPSKDKPSSKAK
jgi:hypothetical protein